MAQECSKTSSRPPRSEARPPSRDEPRPRWSPSCGSRRGAEEAAPSRRPEHHLVGLDRDDTELGWLEPLPDAFGRPLAYVVQIGRLARACRFPNAERMGAVRGASASATTDTPPTRHTSARTASRKAGAVSGASCRETIAPSRSFTSKWVGRRSFILTTTVPTRVQSLALRPRRSTTERVTSVAAHSGAAGSGGLLLPAAGSAVANEAAPPGKGCGAASAGTFGDGSPQATEPSTVTAAKKRARCMLRVVPEPDGCDNARARVGTCAS